MGVTFLPNFTFLFLFLFLSSDSSFAKKLHEKEIQITRKLEYERTPEVFYPSISGTQLDTIPIINPTPTTGTPIVIPQNPPPPVAMFPPTIPIISGPATPAISAPTAPTISTPTAPVTTTPTSSGGTWCVASQSASETALQVALDYACGFGGADCSAIQPGASCYNPSSLRDHASYAFNSYYQKNPGPTSCAFGGTAMLTSTDPSSGSCHYPSAKTSTMAPPTTTTPTIATPSPPAPSTTAPVNPYYNPTTPTIYGEPPTESPSSANSLSLNLLLLITVTFLPTLARNHI